MVVAYKGVLQIRAEISDILWFSFNSLTNLTHMLYIIQKVMRKLEQLQWQGITKPSCLSGFSFVAYSFVSQLYSVPGVSPFKWPSPTSIMYPQLFVEFHFIVYSASITYNVDHIMATPKLEHLHKVYIIG